MASKDKDWRSKCSTVPNAWFTALEDKRFTDVNILVGTGSSTKRFSAHKCVLAFYSPKFEEMFFGCVPEQIDFEIPDVEPETFKKILGHAYGESILFSGFLEAYLVYLAADKYSLPMLKSLVEEYIQNSKMRMEDFYEISHLDNFFNIGPIKDKWLSFFKSNAEEILRSYEFPSVSVPAVEAILQMERLDVGELELMVAMVKWGKKNRYTEDEFKTFMQAVMTSLKFSRLSPLEFCKFLDLYGEFLEDRDALMIMKHILDNAAYKLPNWCLTKETFKEETDSGSNSDSEHDSD